MKNKEIQFRLLMRLSEYKYKTSKELSNVLFVWQYLRYKSRLTISNYYIERVQPQMSASFSVFLTKLKPIVEFELLKCKLFYYNIIKLIF